MSGGRRATAVLALVAAVLGVFLWLRGRAGSPSAETPARGAAADAPEAAARPGLEAGTAAPKPAAATPTPEAAVPATAAAPAWRVEGRVLDAAGKAVSGATVEASFSWGRERRAIPSAVSGPDGAYTLDLAPARAMGPIAIQGSTLSWFAWADGRAPSERAHDAAWPKASAFDVHVVRRDLTLAIGDVVRGRVVRTDGTPVPWADVRTCSAEGVGSRTGTLVDGRYVLARPTGGAASVVAFTTEDGTGRVPLDPSPEVRTLRDLVLQTTPSVEGRVVYADGAPVAGVALFAELLAGPGTEPADPCLEDWRVSASRSRADGTFRLLLPRAGPCRVRVANGQTEEEARTGDRDVRLVLTAHRIRVRFVDAQGAALPGLAYTSIAWDPERAARLADVVEGRSDIESARASADEVQAGSPQGPLEFFLAPGSAWLFVAHADGIRPLEATLRVPATGNETEVRLEPKASAGEGSIRLRATDPADAAISLLYVVASTPLGSSLWRGALPDDGLIPSLPEGPVRLDLRPIRDRTDAGLIPPPGSWLLPATARVTVATGPPTEANVRIRWGGRVRLVLRSPSGTAPDAKEEYAMRLVPTGGGDDVYPMAYPEDPSGKPPQMISSHFAPDRPVITAEVIPAGDYRLEVSASGRGWTSPVASSPIRVLAHETVDLALDLPRER